MNRLEGKVVLITGAASGQGKTCAELFVSEGAKVIVTDIQVDSLTKTVKEINQKVENSATSLVLDVSAESDWIKVARRIDDVFGKLDVLVNSAGIPGTQHNQYENLTVEEWQSVFDVNTLGNFLGIKHVAPLMKKNGGGSIINISSIAAMHTSLGMSAYGASKGATRILTKGSAVTLGNDKIRVNSIHPGVIKTPMSQPLMENELLREKFLSRIPLREFGDSEDIGFAALYLASDEAKFITGAELVIDGGQTVS